MIRLLRAVLATIWEIVGGFPFRMLEVLGQCLPENSAGCRIRGAICRLRLKHCGRNFQVGLNAKMEHLGNIEVGDDVYIGHGSWISGLRGGIVFEDQVMLGPYVTMVSSDHSFQDGSARFGVGRPGAIRIGRGSWLGAQVVVTAGTTIGRSVLVAAGAVVTRDVPPSAVVAGVPARVIGTSERCVVSKGISPDQAKKDTHDE